MRSKRMSLREAAGLIPSGSSITLSGAILPRQPMAFIHGLVRRGVRDLTVKLFVGSVGVDLLIGAGAVRRVETAYVGLGPFGLAPNFRRSAEAGRLEVEDMSESALMARFRASGYGVPYLPTKALLGTSMAEHTPNAVAAVCPFTGEQVHEVRAAHSDFTIVHGHWADEYGNVQHPVRRNTDECDQMLAKAASRLIVTVEKIVPLRVVRDNSTLTWIPHHWVEAVVEVPYGAHPGSCDGLYSEDEAHLRLYALHGKTEEGFRAYLDTYVTGVKDHWEYLERIGGIRRLCQLRM